MDVLVWRAEAAWERSVRMRGLMGRSVTTGLSRSREIMKTTSINLRAKTMPKRTQVGQLGKSNV